VLRKSALINGCVSVLAGVLMVSQPALPSIAQTASPLQSPPASPTPAYTPPPTFTPQPTFTPLPPMTPTPIPPIAAPINTPLPPSIDPNVIIGGGLLGIIVLLIVWIWLRRSRRGAAERATAERAAQPTEPVIPIAPPPPPMVTLEFADTAGGVVRFTLDTPSLTLGRSADNNLIVPDTVPAADTVSQHHAQFRRDQDDYIVRDLNSQNGLTVNGRHTNHNILHDGDRIAFGAAEAVFRKPSGGAA
jgi:hypothetical protein